MREDTVEDAALSWLTDLGYAVRHGPGIAPGEAAAERSGFGEVVLPERLRVALAQLNPTLPAEALEEAFRKITIALAPSFIANNRALHRLLVDGIAVDCRRADGSIGAEIVRVVDFDDPDANDWVAVNQFTVIEGQHNRRPDVVVFVNGLPLGVSELKNPADENATIWTAFQQAVRAALVKSTAERKKSPEEIDAAIRQIISRAVASEEVVDIFAAAGLKKPDISILSEEFLAEVRGLPQKHLAVELLRKLLSGEIKAREKKFLVQARSFAELLERSIRRYQNRAIETAAVIEELIQQKGDLMSQLITTHRTLYLSFLMVVLTAGSAPGDDLLVGGAFSGNILRYEASSGTTTVSTCVALPTSSRRWSMAG